MLDTQMLVPFLIKKGKISKKDLIEGSIVIVNTSRRNNNFTIHNKDGSSYLLKQGIEKENKSSLKRESEIYKLFEHDNDFAEIKQYIPKFYYYNSNHSILLIELLKNSKTLRQHFLSFGLFATYIASDKGKILGVLHRLSGNTQIATKSAKNLAGTVPFCFQIYRPDIKLYYQLSNASRDLIKIIQNSEEYCEELKKAGEEWCPSALIHGDIRWDNWLVQNHKNKSRVVTKLIDWEYSSWGDPAWDIGSVFSEYLKTWIMSISIFAEIDKYDLDLAQFPIEKMQPSFKMFWRSYKRNSQITNVQASELLRKSIKYSGIKILQSLFENLQSAREITNQEIYLIQVSLNILKNPNDVFSVLLNLDD